MFDGLLIERDAAGGQTVSVRHLDEADLPDGDVLVDIAWSTLNYKDALAITGRAPIVRAFPMVPEIDFAGVVAESTDPRWRPGDQVILNGWARASSSGAASPLGHACLAPS